MGIYVLSQADIDLYKIKGKQAGDSITAEELSKYREGDKLFTDGNVPDEQTAKPQAKAK